MKKMPSVPFARPAEKNYRCYYRYRSRDLLSPVCVISLEYINGSYLMCVPIEKGAEQNHYVNFYNKKVKLFGRIFKNKVFSSWGARRHRCGSRRFIGRPLVCLTRYSDEQSLRKKVSMCLPAAPTKQTMYTKIDFSISQHSGWWHHKGLGVRLLQQSHEGPHEQLEAVGLAAGAGGVAQGAITKPPLLQQRLGLVPMVRRAVGPAAGRGGSRRVARGCWRRVELASRYRALRMEPNKQV